MENAIKKLDFTTLVDRLESANDYPYHTIGMKVSSNPNDDFGLEDLKQWKDCQVFEGAEKLDHQSFYVFIRPMDSTVITDVITGHRWAVAVADNRDIDTGEVTEISFIAFGEWLNMRTFRIQGCEIYDHEQWYRWMNLIVATLKEVQIAHIGCDTVAP